MSVCVNVTVIKAGTTRLVSLTSPLSLLPLQVTIAAASVWQSCENEADWIKILCVIRGQEYGACTKHTQPDSSTHRLAHKPRRLEKVEVPSTRLLVFQQKKTKPVVVANSYYPILIKFPVSDMKNNRKIVHPHSTSPESCVILKKQDIITTWPWPSPSPISHFVSQSAEQSSMQIQTWQESFSHDT